MITIDSDPILNPVYIGASIINELKSSNFTEVKIESLYEISKKNFDISYEIFAFTLDWLYIIGVVDLNSNGCIEYAAAKIKSNKK